VRVEFIKNGARGDSPEDQLLVQFQGMFAEYEKAQLMERYRRGKAHRARTGSVNVLSGAPFGYRYLRKTDHAGAAYQIAEDEAVLVAELFRRYADEGASIADLARWLTGQGGAHPHRQSTAGTARWSGACCATPPTPAPRSSCPGPTGGQAELPAPSGWLCLVQMVASGSGSGHAARAAAGDHGVVARGHVQPRRRSAAGVLDPQYGRNGSGPSREGYVPFGAIKLLTWGNDGQHQRRAASAHPC
jgi:hypothetical protein